QLRALEHLLFTEERLSFAQAAWAVHWGWVHDEADRAFVWRGEAMCHPQESELQAYLSSAEYAAAAEKASRATRYRLARWAFVEQWEREQWSLLLASS